MASSAKHAKHHRGNSHVVSSVDVTQTPAYRYGMMSAEECDAELTARGIAYENEPSPGVQSAVRLTGPLHGVTFRSDLAAAARATTPYELADCRLVLALDDFAKILSTHDVVEVVHYSMYRPPGQKWPDDKIGAQHIGALSIDAARFVTSDGHSLEVERDFHGRIGGKTCGEHVVRKPVTPTATELRAILCEAVAARLFTVVLTPNHNRAHRNHFHMEITAAVKWFMVD